MEAQKLTPIPAKYCSSGHTGEILKDGATLVPSCCCGWVGHGINTDRGVRPAAGFFRGTSIDALRELAGHVGYDRQAHLKELDRAIASLQLAELNGGVASIQAAHQVVDIQNELDALEF